MERIKHLEYKNKKKQRPRAISMRRKREMRWIYNKVEEKE